MPPEQTKLTVYHLRVRPNPRDLVATTDRAAREEEAATELAFRIACEDPTEWDHLSHSVTRTRDCLGAAVAELVRSALALLFAYLTALSLCRYYRKVTVEREEVGRAERAALALEGLLARRSTGWVPGRGRLIGMLGAARGEDTAGKATYTLKLAERRYHLLESPEGSPEYARVSDAPVVRVLLGVRVAGRGEPMWVVKGLENTGTGAWRECRLECAADAGSALLRFYSDTAPAPFESPALRLRDLAPASGEPPAPDTPDAGLTEPADRAAA